MKGKCLSDNIVYRCDVTTDNEDESRFYLGSCSTQWKSRLHNHTKSFTHARYSNETTLSTYIWELKNADKAFNLSWSIAAKANSYHPLAGNTVCHLFSDPNLITVHDARPRHKPKVG